MFFLSPTILKLSKSLHSAGGPLFFWMPKDIVEQSFLHGNARKTSPGLVWSRILEECVQVGTYAFFCLWLLVFMLHNSLWASRFFHATWNLFRHLPLVDMAAVCERFGRKSIDHGKNSRLQDGLVNFWLYTHLGHASGDHARLGNTEGWSHWKKDCW